MRTIPPNADRFPITLGGGGNARLLRLRARSLFVLLTAILFCIPLAQPRAEDVAIAPPPPATQVLVDEQANIIRFIVDGKEAARIDASGFHVNGGIEYTDTIADVGPGYTFDSDHKESVGK